MGALANAQLISKLRANIWKVYVYAFFQCFLVIIPVIVPFWKAKGLTVKEIFLLQGIFGAVLILFDAPAGYLADLLGRKKALVIGSIISALGFQVLWFGESFFDFVIYEMILGVGLSLQSGADVAILYNSLERLDAQGRRVKFLGRRLTFATAGEGVASLLGGVLAGFSLNWPAYANAICAWATVIVAATLYEPDGQSLPRGSHLQNFRSIGKALFGHSRMLTLAIASFIFYGFATYCAVWIFQPYWAERGIAVGTFGYLWAANSFGVAIISNYAHAIEEKLGSVKVIWLIAILPVLGYSGMASAPGLFGLLFILAFPLCRGLNQVIFQDAINTRVPAEMRATTNSIGSLGMRMLFIIFGPMLGHAVDSSGTNHALWLLGAVYAVGVFAITIPLLRQRHAFRMD